MLFGIFSLLVGFINFLTTGSVVFVAVVCSGLRY